MIKLKKILFSNYLYHISPAKHLESIRKHGIIPQFNNIENEKATFLFKNKDDAEDALMNWMGDKFPENQLLILFTIDSTGLNILNSNVDYELKTYDIIPWNNIVNLEYIT